MKVLELKNFKGVSKIDSKELVANSIDKKNLENIKAIFELGRIVDGKAYTMGEVWAVYNEDQADEQNKFLSETTRP